MKISLKRVLSGVAAMAVAASVAPFTTVAPAAAAGTPQNPGADVTPTSGNSETALRVLLPSGASCPGDSANADWRVQTYMVPASVDPGTLTFGSAGPEPGGLGPSFRQPLFTTTGSPIIDQQTANADTAGGPGRILDLPEANFSAAGFQPGDIPPGAYNIGVACTLGPADADQVGPYWNLTATFIEDAASGGPAAVSWSKGAVAGSPTLNDVDAGDEQCLAAYTSPAADPPASSWTASATPQGGGTTVTAAGTSSAATITGLVNGTVYDVSVTQTNALGTSAPSNTLTCTPNRTYGAPVLSGQPQTGAVKLDWTAPADASTFPVSNYRVEVTPAVAGYPKTVSGLTDTVPGTAGTTYTYTVTPVRANGDEGAMSNAVQATPLAAQVITQDISVTRPNGALVFTQICGVNGAIDAEGSAAYGFPALPAVPADDANPQAPIFEGAADPMYDDYPYPDDDETGEPTPNYPTKCTVDLGKAEFVKKGLGAGQFFAASGVMNQVTVVDTRDADTGWTAGGQMSDFSAGGTKRFSGSQLGWTPQVTDDTEAFSDAEGNAYDQVVAAGAAVQANTPVATGLSSGRTLASAGAGQGLGIAVLDARLKVLIPVTADSGVYTGTLTISSI